ncbi:MAG TPA: glycosyltransferase [Thermomicrobiaceae bacterium]|nr:glycosyltransferase [Thermomicrobiaceae bacterium]
MLHRVDLTPKDPDLYRRVVDAKVIAELERLAAPLQGARVLQVNATAYGGGVSTLLRSLVPLYRGLGLDVDWRVMPGTPDFFAVTKGLHNALQGAAFDLTPERRELYLSHNREVAAALGGEGRYDLVVVHDPQPAAIRHFSDGVGARWVWRCHIDTSHPDPAALAFLEPLVAQYDALVYTMDAFVPAELRGRPLRIIAPAIDPLSPKSLPLPAELIAGIVEWAGVSLDRPLISQISRFDPWKDPLGVIEVFRRVRERVPGVQLALVGQMALDDPQGWAMLRQIQDETRDDDDIHVLTNFTGIDDVGVNAFQRASSVVLQKSIREGFGLVVSESLWKGTPVVAGRTGGIPMQMPEGVGGYLVDTAEECVERTVELLRDRAAAARLGEAGRRHVREHFLITRLLADELRLLGSLC